MADQPEISMVERICVAATVTARREVSGTYELYEREIRLFPQLGTDPKWRELWEIKVPSRIGDQQLLVAIPKLFPYAMPSIFLRDMSGVPSLPHVDSKGFVCTFDTATSMPNPLNPQGAVIDCIRRAIEIIEVDPATIKDSDFTEEFQHYWSAEEYHISILTDVQTPREIIVAQPAGKGFSIIADTGESVNEWLQKIGISKQPTIEKAQLILLKGLGRPPFPSTHGEMAARLQAEDPEAYDQLQKATRQGTKPIRIFGAVQGATEVFLIGWRYVSPSVVRGGQRSMTRRMHATKSRKSHAPPQLELARLTANALLIKGVVERVDPTRLTSRTEGFERRQIKELACIGLGSVGSLLADALLRGVDCNTIALYDPQQLRYENVPRHLCGTDLVGESKVNAVSITLGRRAPQLKVHPHQKDILEVLMKRPNALDSSDMVILALGAISAELLLVEHLWHSLKPGTPIVSAWVEPFMTAGHAVISIAGERGCLNCLMDEIRFIHSERVIQNPEHFLRTESGCSPSFTPYGGAGLSAFVSDLALLLINNAEQKPYMYRWIGDLDFAKSQGASFNPKFLPFTASKSYVTPRNGCKLCERHTSTA